MIIKYTDKHGSDYTTEWAKGGCYPTFPVLTFLNGTEWNYDALACISSLRPSSIRVTTGWITTDSRLWRVTVYVDDNNIIKNIEQEVYVDTKECMDGHTLLMKYKKEIYGEI